MQHLTTRVFCLALALVAASVFGVEGLKWQYTHGTRNPEAILPDNWQKCAPKDQLYP